MEYNLSDELKTLGVSQQHVFLKPQMDLSVFDAAINKMMNP
jgi:hypothetical protein